MIAIEESERRFGAAWRITVLLKIRKIVWSAKSTQDLSIIIHINNRVNLFFGTSNEAPISGSRGSRPVS